MIVVEEEKGENPAAGEVEIAVAEERELLAENLKEVVASVLEEASVAAAGIAVDLEVSLFLIHLLVALPQEAAAAAAGHQLAAALILQYCLLRHQIATWMAYEYPKYTNKNS